MKKALGYVFALYMLGLLGLVITLEQRSSVESIALELPELVNTRYDAPPVFSDIKNTKAKKKAFRNYFTTIIDNENERIQIQRDILLRIDNYISQGKTVTPKVKRIINTYAKVYKVDEDLPLKEKLAKLLRRVNIVPRSLAIAQAANESAWGTSRFATKGNNYYGQWCFRKGCGLVPSSRQDDAIHEVRVFSSPAESVRAYIFNINTHPAYAHLRSLRAAAEKDGRAATGSELAAGLTHYSERGEHYIAELRQMIRFNRWQDGHTEEQIGVR